MINMETRESKKASNILIVDDDRETCKFVDLVFRTKGYNTQVVYTGTDALHCVEVEKPDIVVLDVMMPDMDGWETFDRLRKFSNVPVIFLTAMTSGDSAARALAKGVNEYVRKPFHPAELIARVEMLLKSQRYPFRTRRPTVSVIIPTLNEAENLPLVLPYLPLDLVDEVIMVDGRSTDDTVEVARRLLPSIKVILEVKEGKGIALSTGYRAATGDILIVLDADGSHDPREVPRFLNSLKEGADFVKGSRFAPGGGTTDMPRIRQLGNWFFVSLVNSLFNVRFTDLCYGYHAFWRYCLDCINLQDADGFEIDTAIYLRTLYKHLHVTEVPSFEGHRFRGVGKLRTFPDGWRVLVTIARETARIYLSPSKDLYMGFRGQQPEVIPWLIARDLEGTSSE